MLDIKYVIDHLDAVIENLNKRNGDYSYLRELPPLYKERIDLIQKGDELKNSRNTLSKKIGMLMAQGKKDEAETIKKQVSDSKDEIAKDDKRIEEIGKIIRETLLKTPNITDPSLPVGPDDTYNRVERTIGEPTKFDFQPRSHWELGIEKGYFDFDRAVKVAGPRFVFYKGPFAHLERAVASFMLDTHIANGYTEVLPPYMVNTDTMTGTGQLPKFADQAYHVDNQTEGNYWLIPTAEVPVTNLYRGEILKGEDLPIRYTAYSSCFRAEAGAAGRDTRGIIRQHQFQKVELVTFSKPEDSWKELEHLTHEAERILQLLKLPYHVVCLSTGDVGFNAAKCYDLEVWMPSNNCYREISSCSNDTDFQARRMSIRFKRTKDSKPELVHTLNGSGLAVGRTVAAIIENYQNADGSIRIPDVLVPYMGGMTVIK
ncbi:MAG TPA: serine--tRNA ligase [Firmicutes bacterium]|nr:serine--tRNA ligase [Bacillota bacterium]